MDITEDFWLSKVIQKKAYKITSIYPSSAEPSMLKEKNIFSYAKLETTKITQSNLLSKWGFYLVDTNLQLKLKNSDSVSNLEHTGCKFASQEHKEDVLKIASAAFKYSRFHLDPQFKSDVANRIKVEWCNSYFNGIRGKQMVIFQNQEKVLGFLLLLDQGEDRWVIDLVAVSPDAQKQQIGSKMISYALGNCSIKSLTVGTQLANIASVNFYQNNGFILHNAQYVFHYHN